MQPLPERKTIPDKLFYKIGEVSDIAGIESYVLRYWETEFPFLRPNKSRSGHRVYTRKNVELVLQVKHLLYNEKYTIAGVKRKFDETPPKKNSVSAETIERIKKRLKDILHILN
ncbi:MAG: MerR family transcriptional regulator [Nitrospirae bacterium]|nr:MerR family transcriptional regulator [Nitrospirota bacterium]